MLGVSPATVHQALSQRSVAIEAYGLDPEPLRITLEAMGLRVSDTADATVVVVRDYLDPRLDAFSRAALRTRQPWLLVQAGKDLCVGPLFVPGETVSWTYVAHRLAHNRPAERYVRHKTDHAPAHTFEPPAVLAAATFHLAAWELAKWFVFDRNERLENQLIRLDALTLTQTTHRLDGVGPGVVCGRAVRPVACAPKPLVLRSRRKKHTTDGGHRTMSPEEAFARYSHLIDPFTGILRNLRRLTSPSESLMPGYAIDHAMVSKIETLEQLFMNQQAGSSGKGKTDAQARASALFEALERTLSVWQGHEYRVRGSYTSIKNGLHPHTLLGFSARQYASRRAASLCPPLLIPAPFDENEPIEWVPVWSLTEETYSYVPAAYGFMGYPETHPPFCYADSNGNASGITLEEAILQGFFELVERDAAAIYFYNRLRRPAVDLHSFSDPYLADLQHYYRQVLHRDLWVLDVTTDLQVPSFVAVSRHREQHPEAILMGFGCHLDPQIAVARALTEINQTLHNAPAASGNGPTHRNDTGGASWMQTATLAEHPYLAPDQNLPVKTATDYPRLWSEDLLDDVRTCVDRAAQCNLAVYVLDLTREDIGVPVVKVISPGMVHWWRRLGFPRLYDVPAKMKWRKQPLKERALNPFSIAV